MLDLPRSGENECAVKDHIASINDELHARSWARIPVAFATHRPAATVIQHGLIARVVPDRARRPEQDGRWVVRSASVAFEPHGGARC